VDCISHAGLSDLACTARVMANANVGSVVCYPKTGSLHPAKIRSSEVVFGSVEDHADGSPSQEFGSVRGEPSPPAQATCTAVDPLLEARREKHGLSLANRLPAQGLAANPDWLGGGTCDTSRR
jgi:hypothetical protein